MSDQRGLGIILINSDAAQAIDAGSYGRCNCKASGWVVHERGASCKRPKKKYVLMNYTEGRLLHCLISELH